MRWPLLIAVAGVLFVAGCGSGDKTATTSEPKKEEASGQTPQQQIEALQNDHRLNGMERETKIAAIKQKYGLK